MVPGCATSVVASQLGLSTNGFKRTNCRASVALPKRNHLESPLLSYVLCQVGSVHRRFNLALVASQPRRPLASSIRWE
jgi:hypothetical protein